MSSQYSALLAMVKVQDSYSPYGLKATTEACPPFWLCSRWRIAICPVSPAPAEVPEYAAKSLCDSALPAPTKNIMIASETDTSSKARGTLASSMTPLYICEPSFIWKNRLFVSPFWKQSLKSKLVSVERYRPTKWKYGLVQRSMRSACSGHSGLSW